VLSFHHLDPQDKEEGISRMISSGLSIEKIKREIAKCTVLCMNCHADLHHKEKSRD
jgi:hypothetical protein